MSTVWSSSYISQSHNSSRKARYYYRGYSSVELPLPIVKVLARDGAARGLDICADFDRHVGAVWGC